MKTSEFKYESNGVTVTIVCHAITDFVWTDSDCNEVEVGYNVVVTKGNTEVSREEVGSEAVAIQLFDYAVAEALSDILGFKRLWVLKDDLDDYVVVAGDERTTSKGDVVRVSVGIGRPPHKLSSEGKVWVTNPGGSMSQEVYPSVIGCRWSPA